MNNKLRKLMTAGCLSLCMMTAHAQEFKDYLSKYTEENGKGYMQPFADAFGANINSGWFRSAKIKKLGPQIYIGVVGMIAVVPESKKTFLATPEGLFTPKTPTEAPTVFGSGESVTIDGDGGTSYTFPGGLDVKAVPLAAPQLNIGAVLGTDVSLRFMAYDFGEDVGKLNMFGFGVRHSISQYLPAAFPAQLAVGYYWTTFTLGDIIDNNNSFISLQGSYSIKVLTFYGGLGYEMTNMDVGYTFEGEEGGDEDINFALDGGNNVRLTLGMSLNLGPVRLNGDYNISDQSVFSFGLGFGIGGK